MNPINKYKNDKYCSSKSIINLVVAIILLISVKYSFGQTYLTDGQQVPVFNPAFTSYTHRTVYSSSPQSHSASYILNSE